MKLRVTFVHKHEFNLTLQLTAVDLINVPRFVSSAGIGTEVTVTTQVNLM